MKRIVLTGPESTGKSWLAGRLARHYNGLWVPEFARFYVANLQRNYAKEDVIYIARKQVELEQELVKCKPEYLFLDTDLIITKVWLKHVYNEVPQFVDDAIRNLPRDLHLLCNYDLQWEYDPTRENPDKREFFFEWYRKELEYYGLDYRIVSGVNSDRLNCAVNCLKR
ncbi:MAG: ATP-binding protein [Bacteroidales bacterium]|jgi:nicotinamide riboside kinase|nr:ATP-binding protein [Bacteroidales bacterium]